MKPKEFYTVSELNQQVRDVLQFGFPNALWVCGEIQGFDRNKDKRHIFFELCEKDAATKSILARIGLVIFQGKKTMIDKVLRQAENTFELKDDIEVKFLCRVDFYAPHGAVRLVVENIDPVFTLGKIAQDRQRLIAQLTQKGVLEENKKRDMPLVPLRIGLITSYDSAAYNDFIEELGKSGLAFQVMYQNALMQGKQTESSVSKALKDLDARDDLDVIVVTRGGGSIADLSYFDSEKIAVTIAGMKHPVITGIGHEINISVTDLAAHTFAKTPTAVAQFLVDRVRDYVAQLEDNGRQILQTAVQQIQDHKRRLKMDAMGLQQRTFDFLKSHREHLVTLEASVCRQPGVLLQNRLRDLKLLYREIPKSSERLLKTATQHLQGIQKVIDIAHPANTLKRGFSITRGADGKVLRSAADVGKGDDIITQVADGTITSTVKAGNHN